MIRYIEKALYVIAVVLMILNFVFDLPNVGKTGYALLFISFIVSFALKRITGGRR